MRANPSPGSLNPVPARHSTSRSRMKLDRPLDVLAGAWGHPGRWFLRRVPRRPRPFFSALHELLDSQEEPTLGRLLHAAGEQAWGLAVLFLALLTFLPGVANILSLATLVLGLQMAWGAPHPWLPRRLQEHPLHHGRIKHLLARIEARLAWLSRGTRIRRAPSQRFLGLLVALTAFLAALPAPLPFANVLPAAALILYGVALLEEWPQLTWIGLLLTLGTALYFLLSAEVAWRALRALMHLGGA